MTTDQDGRDRSARGAALEDHLRHPDDATVTVTAPKAPPPEKSLYQLSSELKDLIRGDRIFRAGVKR
ncbi:MAG: hypothetical protein CMM77_07210 [Rhodospirillaceae bacterium]|nr:hypothetical protein [Magnetovibrio sp.]MAY66900.1 hypothetical protein [Rhodospirillaceae bacterium]